MSNVEHVLRPYRDPVPSGVGNLDLVTSYFEYHEAVHKGIDRVPMGRRLFDALKPGGVLVVAERPDSGGWSKANPCVICRADAT